MPTAEPKSRLVFQGVRFDVRCVELLNRGDRITERDVVVAPPAVVILPLLDEQTVVLIRNERFAVGQNLWELPAGTLESGEQPRYCAGRELAEETGYRARVIEPMTDFFPSPGICTERMHAFLARDLEHVGQHLDETERITVEPVPLDRSIQMVHDHTIQDGKTIAMLLYYQAFHLK